MMFDYVKKIISEKEHLTCKIILKPLHFSQKRQKIHSRHLASPCYTACVPSSPQILPLMMCVCGLVQWPVEPGSWQGWLRGPMTNADTCSLIRGALVLRFSAP